MQDIFLAVKLQHMFPRCFFLILSLLNFFLYCIFTKYEAQSTYLPLVAFLAGQIGIVFLLGKISSREIKSGKDRSKRGLLANWTLGFGLFLIVAVPAKVAWFLAEQINVSSDGPEKIKAEFFARRAYLIDRVARPDFSLMSMPLLFSDAYKKEWAIGSLSMATAAMTNLAFRYPETQPSSLKHVQTMIERMRAADIRSFEVDYWGEDPIEALPTEKGNIGYLGHLNFMLGAHRMLGGDGRYDELHTSITEALVRRIEKKSFPYLETFPELIFTSDNAVVAASIALYSRAFHRDYSSVLKRWIDYTKENLIDPKTGGIVFYTSMDGKALGENRGSGAGWASFYLPFVDEDFAKQQFEKLAQTMTKTLFGKEWWGGFIGIREYLPGYEGPADVDSGPVILGLSTSGTGFSIAGATRFGPKELLQGLLNVAEIVGSSVTMQGKRCYLLAPLVGDAIMLAMRTSTPWDERFLLSR